MPNIRKFNKRKNPTIKKKKFQKTLNKNIYPIFLLNIRFYKNFHKLYFIFFESTSTRHKSLQFSKFRILNIYIYNYF